MPHEKVLQQSLEQLSTKLGDGELEDVEEKLRGWKIVEHTPQSVQDRLDKVEHIFKQHQDMLVAVERRIELLAQIKVPISAARKECEVMDIPMHEVIRTSLAQITSSTTELEKVTKILHESRELMQGRRGGFEDLDSLQKRLDWPRSVLTRESKLINPDMIRTEIKRLGLARKRDLDQLRGVENDLNATKEFLHETIVEVLSREVKLEVLGHKSENLRDTSKAFYKQVRTLIRFVRPN